MTTNSPSFPRMVFELLPLPTETQMNTNNKHKQRTLDEASHDTHTDVHYVLVTSLDSSSALNLAFLMASCASVSYRHTHTHHNDHQQTVRAVTAHNQTQVYINTSVMKE